jgi:hypothetical protein
MLEYQKVSTCLTEHQRDLNANLNMMDGANDWEGQTIMVVKCGWWLTNGAD